MTDLVLYSVVPYDRGSRVRWTAYELSLNVEERKVNMTDKEHKSEAYKKINPLGQIPAALLNGAPMFDSAAICMRLLELHPDSTLAPAITAPDRAMFLSWLMFGITTLDRAAFDLFRFKRTPENAEKRQEAFERLKPTLDSLIEHLTGKTYIVGDRFSLADIMVAYDLMLLRRDEVLVQFPVLDAYVTRLAARPAAQRAGLFNP